MKNETLVCCTLSLVRLAQDVFLAPLLHFFFAEIVHDVELLAQFFDCLAFHRVCNHFASHINQPGYIQIVCRHNYFEQNSCKESKQINFVLIYFSFPLNEKFIAFFEITLFHFGKKCCVPWWNTVSRLLVVINIAKRLRISFSFVVFGPFQNQLQMFRMNVRQRDGWFVYFRAAAILQQRFNHPRTHDDLIISVECLSVHWL